MSTSDPDPNKQAHLHDFQKAYNKTMHAMVPSWCEVCGRDIWVPVTCHAAFCQECAVELAISQKEGA